MPDFEPQSITKPLKIGIENYDAEFKNDRLLL